MHITENARYLACIEKLHNGFPHWERLEGKQVFLSGASGMIGSFLVDAVMLKNRALPPEKRTRIMGFVRNLEKAEARFAPWLGEAEFTCTRHDIASRCHRWRQTTGFMPPAPPTQWPIPRSL